MTRITQNLRHPRSSAANSHCLLFLRQSYIHLHECVLVERAGHLQPFRLLILAQSLARRIVKLSELLAAVKAALLENGLSLVDLFLGGAKDWAAFRGLLRAGLSCG